MVSCVVVSLVLPVASHGEERSAWLAAAVDAKGVRHRGSEYVGTAPWMNDVVHTVTPEYPFSERAQHHKGSGLLRVSLDLRTGSVTRVALIKSTGFAALDNSALAAFAKWRWKPGTWKEIDVPITFTRGPRGGMSIGSKHVSP